MNKKLLETDGIKQTNYMHARSPSAISQGQPLVHQYLLLVNIHINAANPIPGTENLEQPSIEI